eukprot:CAMPEP_0170415206 /NCGR_PEP_ID=MMETSP0117_2-20130122/32486_1 /TAXON_ID=400756 /ORGANISM="Durinskia baltica, Strain CSIRO CS-38" /LENGTH=52 /DNA_ID=CAMNT_0010673163 /DNA_START=85 /DNA_END=240 /DNA_ORIENTATION=+
MLYSVQGASTAGRRTGEPSFGAFDRPGLRGKAESVSPGSRIGAVIPCARALE